MVETRSLSDMSASTLRHLVALTLNTEEMCEVMCESYESDVRPSAVLERLVSRVAVEGDLSERLGSVLECHLGQAYPSATSVGCLNFFLCQATKSCDILGVAAVLWCAARREGLAWRCFERRADAALELLALQAISFPSSDAALATQFEEYTAVQVILGQGDGAPLARVHIAQAPADTPQDDTRRMSIQLREDELESLYEDVGVALATMKLQHLVSQRSVGQKKGA